MNFCNSEMPWLGCGCRISRIWVWQ